MSDFLRSIHLEPGATCSTVADAAWQYWACGMSVVPVRGKRAIVPWQPYQWAKPDDVTLHAWERQRLFDGVAIVCGAVSRNLVVIDLDGARAAGSFIDHFPHLWATTFRVRTANGAHVYLQSVNLPKTIAGQNLPGGIKEVAVRSDGAYVVAPPSVHPSGEQYVHMNDNPVRRVQHVADVVSWVREMKAAKAPKPTTAPPIRPAAATSTKSRAYVRAYINRGFGWELDKVRAAPTGSRNSTLFHAAIALGQLVASDDNRAHSVLSQADVEVALEGAALRLTETDGLGATRRTIRSGLMRGLQEPRIIPPPRTKRNAHR